VSEVAATPEPSAEPLCRQTVFGWRQAASPLERTGPSAHAEVARSPARPGLAAVLSREERGGDSAVGRRTEPTPTMVLGQSGDQQAHGSQLGEMSGRAPGQEILDRPVRRRDRRRRRRHEFGRGDTAVRCARSTDGVRSSPEFGLDQLEQNSVRSTSSPRPLRDQSLGSPSPVERNKRGAAHRPASPSESGGRAHEPWPTCCG